MSKKCFGTGTGAAARKLFLLLMKTQKPQKKKPADPTIINIDLRDWRYYETERMTDGSFILTLNGESPGKRRLKVQARFLFDDWSNLTFETLKAWTAENAERTRTIHSNNEAFGLKPS